MRIPLATTLESRDGDLTQDARLKNSYIDTEENTPNVVKRAGLTLIQTTGDGEIPQGFFIHDGSAYSWFESDPVGTPTVTQITGGREEFRDFSFEFIINAATPPSDVDAGHVTESSIGLTDPVIQVSLSVSYFDPNYQLVGAIGSTTGGSTIFGPMATAEGSYLGEVKLEADNYNFYLDSVLIGSLASDGEIFSTPTLTEYTGDTFVTIQNIQFI